MLLSGFPFSFFVKFRPTSKDGRTMAVWRPFQHLEGGRLGITARWKQLRIVVRNGDTFRLTS